MSRIIAALALVTLSSCAKATLKSVRVHEPPSSGVNTFFTANFPGAASVADVAGYNDEQRLPGNGNRDYGAIVRLYVAPVAPSPANEANGALVALMEVLGGDGQPRNAYNMLKIGNDILPTLYCVFIKTTGNPQQPYDGYVTPVQSDHTTCTPIGTTNQYKLSATPDPTSQDAPYVARFVMDDHDKPAIAVGCLNGSTTTYVVCHLGRGVYSDKKALADQQEIAVPSSSGDTVPDRSGITGSVTPTGTQTIGTQPIQVATINLSAAPPTPSIYATWGLGSGDNGVWLHKDNANNYFVQFVQGSGAPGSQTSFPMTRNGHSTVPTGARWLWNDGDEDLWLACDQGCCTVGDSKDGKGKGPK